MRRFFDAARDATPVERRVINLAIFERIEVGPDAEITGTRLTPVYKALTAWQPGLGQPKLRGDRGLGTARHTCYLGAYDDAQLPRVG
jgi:hypothetical protein